MTLRELVYDALRVIGVIEVGQTASADEDTEDLRVINSMLNSWRAERLMAYTMVTNIYTAGSDGRFTVPRPAKIEAVYIISSEGYSPVKVNESQYRFAGGIFSDGAYPTSKLTMTPAAAPGTQILLESWVVLPAFASMSDTVTFPEGYAEALQYNLALRLAPRYRDAMVSPLVLSEARESLARVKRLNRQTPTLEIDPALFGGYGNAIASGGLQIIYGGGGGGGGSFDTETVIIAILAELDSINIVPYSATPVFDLSLGRTQQITLSGNVTSSSVINQTAGRSYTFKIHQDGTGGRTFAWPSVFRGEMEIGYDPDMGSMQEFLSDGTNLWATSTGLINA